MRVNVDLIWPRHRGHYLFVDEGVSEDAYEPYVSSSLKMILWAHSNGLLEPLAEAAPVKSKVRDWKNICAAVPCTDWIPLVEVAERAEDGRIDSIGRALLYGIKFGVVERKKFPSAVGEKLKPVMRWFYRRKPTVDDARPMVETIINAELEAKCIGMVKQSETGAIFAAEDMMYKHPNQSFTAYRCHYCSAWHVGHTNGSVAWVGWK